MTRFALFCVLCVLGGLGVGPARSEVLTLSLSSAESSALAGSARLEAASQELAASRERADSQWSQLLPRVALDGSYKHVSQVPALQLSPTKSTPFGDDHTTSYGIGATWTLWDTGALYKGWRAQQARARSREEEARLARRQVLLGVRLAYFQLQLAHEQEKLVDDSLKLVNSQFQDIDRRRAAGAASKIDSLSAHQEELDRRRQLAAVRAERAGALRELFTLTGGTQPADPGAETLTLQLDALEPPAALAAAADAGFDEGHPQLQALGAQADAAALAAGSVSAGRWPKVQATARASYDYPNGPVLETVQQNTLGLTASLPLFEGGRTRDDAREQERLAAALGARRRAAAEELREAYGKARDQLASLKAQAELDRQAVAETEELSRLVYNAYSAGSRTYLEVQAANLRALQAKVAAARTQAQTSIQLAILNSLTGNEK